MKTTTLSAHFDGKQIVLDEPHEMKPNTRLLVTVLPSSKKESLETFRDEWYAMAEQSLADAYGPDEPDYDMSMVKEPNPEYEGR